MSQTRRSEGNCKYVTPDMQLELFDRILQAIEVKTSGFGRPNGEAEDFAPSEPADSDGDDHGAFPDVLADSCLDAGCVQKQVSAFPVALAREAGRGISSPFHIFPCRSGWPRFWKLRMIPGTRLGSRWSAWRRRRSMLAGRLWPFRERSACIFGSSSGHIVFHCAFSGS